MKPPEKLKQKLHKRARSSHYHMLRRCRSLRYYPDYSHIDVHPAWLIFEQFLSDMGLPPSLKHSLDRIDNTKGYHPENVRWATPEEQNNNKSNNVYVVVGGERMTIAQAIARYNPPVHHTKVYERIQNGWDVLDALTLPPLKKESYKSYCERTKPRIR